MEKEKSKINQDAMLITEIQPDGSLINKEIAIEHPHAETTRELKAIDSNPNKTILDAQDRFFKEKFTQKYHHVCLLHEYNLPYIEGAKFPEGISYDEYQRKLEDKSFDLIAAYVDNDKTVDEVEAKKNLERYAAFLKHEFVEKKMIVDAIG